MFAATFIFIIIIEEGAYKSICSKVQSDTLGVTMNTTFWHFCYKHLETEELLSWHQHFCPSYVQALDSVLMTPPC
jgi:hypothetical protein